MLRFSLKGLCVAFAAVVLVASTAPTQAAPILNYQWNFSDASGGPVANITNVHEGQFLASSRLGFNDLDGSGGQSVGDTFRDYSLVRITGFTDIAGNNVTPAAYGSGPGRSFELTFTMVFDGTVIGPNAYAVDTIENFDVWMDFGGGFTGSDFLDAMTFSDTPIALGGPVETGVLGGPSSGTFVGPTAPDGTTDLILALSDQLGGILGDPAKTAELDEFGNPLNTIGPLVLQGITDANNLATPSGFVLGGFSNADTANGNAVTTGFSDVFTAFGLLGSQLDNGLVTSMSDFSGAYDFAFSTRSDGSFTKAIVPEPSSFVLMGLGIIGVGFVARRNRKNKAVA